MEATQAPVYFRKAVMHQVKEHIKAYKEQGYKVSSRVMFFTPLGCRKAKRVKVLVKAVKVEPYINPKMMILRADGSWR